ncbi:hypothetical protein JGH11_09855 [Dysgonomonas sp. Marseille-P4677]|uniref:hypothetical protein n=1 Tax=Dysgonomonas sp. Marseille-P4677 TaxID=2364790 RepID=UPI001911361A|nr:hypothetical protein [Dysgonomonas sp. Marseille-P4677]MBK5721172.1 hypothetical protein [Dysgonomonas sp. Marseille-P4677]
MKQRIILLCLMLAMVCGSVLAQLPYSKMLDLTESDLKEKKFKYDSNKNRYSMSKTNKTNQTMNILSAVGGNVADMKPHTEDYTITLQKGADNQTAFLSVLFYNDDTYHNIATWMVENGIEPITTNSGKLTVCKFDYEGLKVELTTELVSIKTTTKNTFAAAKSFDDSYNVYYYTIYTGITPESKWHTKEAEKKEKNKLKGKKEDLNDLM